jgi:hypothetical protein
MSKERLKIFIEEEKETGKEFYSISTKLESRNFLSSLDQSLEEYKVIIKNEHVKVLFDKSFIVIVINKLTSEGFRFENCLVRKANQNV